MRPTSTLCTARAAHHRILADAASLDNVRNVELAAAAAWDKEGLLADKREAGADAGLLATLGNSDDDLRPETVRGPECD